MNKSNVNQAKGASLETSDSYKKYELIVKDIKSYKEKEKKYKGFIAVVATINLFYLAGAILLTYEGFTNNDFIIDPLATSAAIVIGTVVLSGFSAYHAVSSVQKLIEIKSDREELETKLIKINEENILELTPKKDKN